MDQVIKLLIYEWRDILKRGVFALGVIIVSALYPLTNNPVERVKVIETFVDKAIPFNRLFVIPYVVWYGYVVIFIFLLCVLHKEAYYKLITTISVGMLLCYVVYYFYPTHVPRPVVVGDDLLSNLVLSIYANDNPYNCMPSIHVLNTLLVAMFVSAEEKFHKVIKIVSAVIAVLIILSTMFIKQHYFVDVISATILAYILFFIVNTLHFKHIAQKKMRETLHE